MHKLCKYCIHAWKFHIFINSMSLIECIDSQFKNINTSLSLSCQAQGDQLVPIYKGPVPNWSLIFSRSLNKRFIKRRIFQHLSILQCTCKCTCICITLTESIMEIFLIRLRDQVAKCLEYLGNQIHLKFWSICRFVF